MRGLGKWATAIARSQRLKTRWSISKRLSRGKSLLSKKEQSSGSRESAAVHQTQSSLFSLSDETGMGDNDPAVERTVEMLSVAGSDAPASVQEKEAGSVGGIPSQ